MKANNKESRPRLAGKKKINHDFFNSEESRVLVIGDTHFPFVHDNYFDFIVDTYNKYNCNRVVHIGDVLDSHTVSYHETSADAFGGKTELAMAREQIKKWHKQFPKVDVLWGNHGRLVMRKAQSGGIPSEWIRDIAQVLEVPGWEWHYDLYIDNVRYTHGDAAGKARTACKRDMQSTVTGHYHTDLYTEYAVGANSRVFGMAVGCGINDKSYAMSYAKGGKKSALGCGVVIGGQVPIAVPMQMEDYK
jgi:predicted phosphodiesterase